MQSQERDPIRTVEILISRLLFWGGLVSIAVLLLGLVLYAGGGGLGGGAASVDHLLEYRPGGNPAEAFQAIADVLQGVSRHPGDPLAVGALGLILLLATPVLGVALAIPAFAWARDYRYVLIAGTVFVILIVSFFVEGGGG